MMEPREALDRLMKGNIRYVRGEMDHPRVDPEHRETQVGGQQPFAVVLCCSDSRVVPNLIFDCGVGDLFVIRVAGNVVDDSVLGSIEYAVKACGSKLVMVLGHEACGAVTATVDAGGSADGIDDHTGCLIERIGPAVKRAQSAGDQSVDGAIRHHAVMVGDSLRGTRPVLANAVDDGQLKVVSAYYNLSNGAVEVLKRNDFF